MTDLASFGQEVGGYRVESPIGTGSLGQVFNAHRTADGRAVALKLFAPTLTQQPDFQALFGQIVGAAAALHHPNIVEIYDFGAADGQTYVAMELLPNGSVASLLRERAGALLPLDQGIELARQAAVGLAYAHGQGRVHRDIRPENLLLARTFAGYNLKIGDFGMAQLGESDGEAATGAMPGAPAYLAPEQFQGLEPDGRSDIYSLGVVLYVVVTGRLPFAATTLSQAIHNHINMPPPPPRALRPDMSAELETIILRCLAKQPAERFASADELARALAALVAAPAPQAESDDAPTFIGMPAPTVPVPIAAAPDAPAPPAESDDAATFIGMPEPPVPAPIAPRPIEPAPTVPTPIAPEPPAPEPIEVAPTVPVPIAPTPPAASGDMPTVIGMPAPAAPPVASGDMPTVIGIPVPAADASASVDDTVIAPVAILQPDLATQALQLGTPAPGFPAMPPQKSIPQIQAFDTQGAQVRLIDLTGDGVAVGRLPDNELMIDHDSVSERHAQIDWDGNLVNVTDLGSKNGTFINGTRLIAQVPQDWEPGKAIQIGPYWLRLVPAQLAAAPSIMMAPPMIIPSPAVSRAGVELPGTTSTPIGQPFGQYTPPPPPPAPFTTPSLGSQSGMMDSRGPATNMAAASRQREVLAVDPAGVSWIDVALEEEVLTLTPGQPTVVRMLLTNRDVLVDHFSIAVVGAPKTWTIASTLPEYQVLPGKDTPAALTVTVPRSPENRAGVYPITVQARSKKNPAEAGVASAQWTILAFDVLSLDLKPKRATAWRSAHYTAIVKNGGNMPASYALHGEDDEQAIDFQFQQDKIFLDPGATARIKLTARSPLRLFGSAQTRGFSVGVEPEAKKQSQTAIGQFIQRALIPLWLIPLLLVAAVALYFFATRPPQIVALKAAPTVQIVGSPVTVSWEVSSNAQRALLQSDESGLAFNATPDKDNKGKFIFGSGTAIPADLSLVAYTRFGIQVEQPLSVPVQTASPTVTPSPTPTPTSTLTPQPTPTLEPIIEPTLEPPVEVPTTIPVTNTEVIVPPPAAPANQLACQPGSAIAIDGNGAPRLAAFLLYFDGRPVSGGTVAGNGTYRAVLVIENEAPGKYPVIVRLRDGDHRVLALFTFFSTGGQSGELRDENGDNVLQITCIVPVITPIPTPTSGVIVFPPRAP